MAGIPSVIVRRADELLEQLEQARGSHKGSPGKTGKGKDAMQLSFFQLDDPVLEQIKEEILKTDINNLTPVEALNKLNEIRKLLGKG
jgi:DNA mismatch repair protein MutS